MEKASRGLDLPPFVIRDIGGGNATVTVDQVVVADVGVNMVE